MMLVEKIPRVFKAVKAKGGYFEESQIYFWGYDLIPYVLFYTLYLHYYYTM
jgi:hypothetical protein